MSAVVAIAPVRAAGIMFVTPDGNALFLKRSMVSDHPGEWCFPGGRIEDDETAEEAAVREAGEEAGVIPKGDRVLHTRQIAGGRTFSPGGPATAGAVPQSLPATSAAPATPLVEAVAPVDFTTFIQRIDEPFEPTLNDEHVGFAWAPVASPPEPLHPGCGISLRRLTMDELGVAKAMAAGELTSPQFYMNHWLFAIRITGTGVSYRSKDEELVVRDPSIYLTQEFLERCNGLPVVFEHPEKATLDSDEFMNRVVGSIFLPYICGDEVWGIAKIHDAAAARIMGKHKLSTSPGVLFQNPKVTNTKVELEDGSIVLFEGKPALLDHVAVVPYGVWDKGGEPTGVKSETREDSMPTEAEKAAADAAAKDAQAKADAAKKDAADEKAKADQAKKDADEKAEKEKADAAKADADAGTIPDKVLKKLDSVISRMDAYDEKEKAKSDAEAKAKKDAEEEEKKKADKAKADAEEEARKKGDPAQMAADKAKKDADEKAEKDAAKKDSEETRKKIADLEDRLKPRADADIAAMADAQAKADAVYMKFGKRAPRFLDGESLLGYRKRLAAEMKPHSPTWAKVDLAAIADGAAFDVMETQVYADAERTAMRPTDLQAGQLREMRHTDATGRTITTFVGDPVSWMAPFAANRRRVAGIRNQS